MKFSLVTETFPPDVNGVAMTLHRLSGELEKRGHSVHVICPGGHKTSGLPGSHGGKTTRVRGWQIPAYPEARIGWLSPSGFCRLWRDEKPDLVHIATEGPLGWMALKAAKRMQIPVVASFHTNFHHYAQHYGAAWLEGAVASYLKSFHNQALCNLVPDPGLMRDLDAMGFLNNVFFGRGVDTQLFHPDKRDEQLRRAWNVKDAEQVILHVSRVAVEKDIPLVLELYRGLKQKQAGLKCVVVGDGPQRASLEKAYPEVTFSGYLFGEDLARAYASADFFFFASQTETFGNVLTEALASGLAVLAYDYAAARQYIVHGRNGLSVQLGDRGAFEEQARALFDQDRRDEISQLRIKARETAAGIPWCQVVDSYLKNIQRCLLKGKASRPGHLGFSELSLE